MAITIVTCRTLKGQSLDGLTSILDIFWGPARRSGVSNEIRRGDKGPPQVSTKLSEPGGPGMESNTHPGILPIYAGWAKKVSAGARRTGGKAPRDIGLLRSYIHHYSSLPFPLSLSFSLSSLQLLVATLPSFVTTMGPFCLPDCR